MNRNSEYVTTEKLVLLNFSQRYCKTQAELLNSDCFSEVWSRYVNHVYKIHNTDVIRILELSSNPKIQFVTLFQILLAFDLRTLKVKFSVFNELLAEQDGLYDLVNDFYDYWRRLQRYGVMYARSNAYDVESVNFIDSAQAFNQLVISAYRNISEKIYGKHFSIYRELPAGVNASILISKQKVDLDSPYGILNGCSFIESIMIRPPFIAYSAKNKRTGTYQEVLTSPLDQIQMNIEEFFCYATKVGDSLAYVYFHRDYMAHGITLCNLFEFVPRQYCEGKKPDLIYLFGVEMEGDSVFYYDHNEDIYLGVAPHNDSIDYFGYMKKMLLTLHNVKMIERGYLPVHGACVNITMKDGQQTNVVIIGDSGAGKSESLEALSTYAGDSISSMKTIFDDMGTFKFVNDEIYAFGTEIGAFVRLDDMAADYAYNEMDRAIFMNPNQVNSRLVVPVATYREIMAGYKVDMVLYANNFETKGEEVSFFPDSKTAKEVFIRGARYAKGTTQEIGLVESFFANPFGPVQKEEKTRVLIDFYFDKMFEKNIKVGELHTRLAVPGYEQDGPALAAEKLFKVLEK